MLRMELFLEDAQYITASTRASGEYRIESFPQALCNLSIKRPFPATFFHATIHGFRITLKFGSLRKVLVHVSHVCERWSFAVMGPILQSS